MIQDMNEPVKMGIDLDVINNVLNDKAGGQAFSDINYSFKMGIDLDVINNVLNDKAEETGKIKKRNKMKTERT